MALSIQTNIASLQAQNNLSQADKALAKNQERLASGLRINTAADDAAGMAISDRMSAQIRGLNQAVRNANDAISVTNVAEGALQETTDILQRMRELSVQSANDSNTASDRASIQDEVNQLKSEIDRIANNTDFNGTKLLDGTFSSKNFQVGNNSNQTISLSVASAQGKDMGNYTVTSNNESSKALSAATWSAQSVDADGAGLGDVTTNGSSATAAADAAMPGQDLTFEDADGNTASHTIDDGDSAYAIADGINGDSNVTDLGVRAVAAANSADFSLDNLDDFASAGNTNTVSFDFNGDNISFTVDGKDKEEIYTKIADEIEGEDTNFNVVDVSEEGLTIENEDGRNIGIGDVNVDTGGGTQAVDFDLGGTSVNGDEYAVKMSTVSLELDEGVSVSSDATKDENIFGVAGDVDAPFSDVKLGSTDVSGGNNVVAQDLTILGPEGTVEGLEIGENSSAKEIADAVNNVAGETGVNARAETTLSMSNLSADGTIKFDLYGSNSEEPREIRATVTQNNLQSLVDAINQQTGATGITADLATNGDEMTLTSTEGHDIKIANFEHSSSDSGTQSIEVEGQEGDTVSLSDSGDDDSDKDSTVVGGTVTFESTGSFGVRSDKAAEDGGIFAGKADDTALGDLTQLSTVDVSTYQGAQDAIDTIDAAIQQIDDIRGELGAKTNRFESTINNLENVSQNVTDARAQIRDADIAKEAADMTQNNVRQQATASVLTQANQTPQIALQLLGG